jgi:hypothetical protein
MTDRGHNNPPEMLELATEVAGSISLYMAEHPVVEDEAAARDCKMQIDRAKLCVRDLETERDGKVRPLNDKVAYINDTYRRPRRVLSDLLDEMLLRLQIFVKAEEFRRQAIAMQLAAEAAEAALHAREMERIEREKLDDASKGEIGIDVAEVTEDADIAFEEYEKAERAAIRAERQTHVKIGGGLGNRIGLKNKETLILTDFYSALCDMGVSPEVKEAILKSARAYRKVHQRLPRGVTSEVEKEL